jgi:hypothetical protein
MFLAKSQRRQKRQNFLIEFGYLLCASDLLCGIARNPLRDWHKFVLGSAKNSSLTLNLFF